MAVVNYLIKQNICSTHDTVSPSFTLKAENINYPSDYDGDKVQQFILQPYIDDTSTTFAANTCYYIRLQMPQDQNYDMHYGIRLMTINKKDNSDELEDISLKDSNQYQFIKYMSIPRLNPNNINNSTIWLYKIDSIINAAVAKPLNEYANDTSVERATKIYYDDNTVKICDSNGDFRTHDGNNENFSTIIGEPLKTQMANNFTNTNNNDPIIREFVFMPEIECNAIYLYLKPISDDSLITWKDDNDIIMMGRHIKDISTITGQGINLNNTRNEVKDLSNITNIAVWGRSEQLMLINGQELKIGPSGYFELKNYDIDSLYIINSADDDKYTVDIQYQKV